MKYSTVTVSFNVEKYFLNTDNENLINCWGIRNIKAGEILGGKKRNAYQDESNTTEANDMLCRSTNKLIDRK